MGLVTQENLTENRHSTYLVQLLVLLKYFQDFTFHFLGKEW